MTKRTNHTQPTPKRTFSTVMPYLEPEQLNDLLKRVESAHVAAHNLHNAIRTEVVEGKLFNAHPLTVLALTTSYRIEIVHTKLEMQGLTEEPIIDLLKLLRRYIDGVTRSVAGIPLEPDIGDLDPMLPPAEYLHELTHRVMVKLAEIAEQVRLELEEWE